VTSASVNIVMKSLEDLGDLGAGLSVSVSWTTFRGIAIGLAVTVYERVVMKREKSGLLETCILLSNRNSEC